MLPALKVGKALWVDNPSDEPSSPSSAEVITPPADDVDMSEYESEEEAPMPTETKVKPTRARK